MNRFPTKILLATDGSENASQAAEAAVDLARRSGSELHVVHVWHVLLGSHSEGIVHHSHRPVLVVRHGENVWPPARIVASDDFSEDARKAAELAASIGKLFGARPAAQVHRGPGRKLGILGAVGGQQDLRR